jgi:hypothetical protein
MKALTLWQPWASLVMIGAKPNEFRKWNYRTREPKLRGERIVIHAGAREVRAGEVMGLIRELEAGRGSLIKELALPLLRKVADTYKCRALPIGMALGTVSIGWPFKVEHFAPDSDRVSHHLWAWPMIDPELFPEPVPCSGKQGFWTYGLRIGPNEKEPPERSRGLSLTQSS